MKVLVGISTRNRAELLTKAIYSALEQDYADVEIVVFDDASIDDTPKLIEKFPQVRWQKSLKPQGYLPLRNQMMRETDAAFYCSLDDDAWFIKGDEISRGVELLIKHSNVAALAYDILSPDCPAPKALSIPYPTNMFIGCGHLLRLSAVKEVGYYSPYPGFYGVEEKDLCAQLFNCGYEILYLPGVHVWHDKTMLARDQPAQHRSGVCNDLAFTLRRCPFPEVLWMLPGKSYTHLNFSLKNGYLRSYMEGVIHFIETFPSTFKSRNPVSKVAYQRVRQAK